MHRARRGRLRRRPVMDGEGHEPKVGHANSAIVADEHVRRLEVAVHQLGRVCGREPAPGLDEALQDRPVRARLRRAELVHPVPHRLAADVLHRHVHAPLVHPDIVHADDVGMGDAGHRLSLSKHASVGPVAAVMQRVDDLERDRPPQLLVARAQHEAHPAGADRAEDLVVPDPLKLPRHVKERRAELIQPEVGLQVIAARRRSFAHRAAAQALLRAGPGVGAVPPLGAPLLCRIVLWHGVSPASRRLASRSFRARRPEARAPRTPGCSRSARRHGPAPRA